MSRLASLFIEEDKKQKQGIELDVVESSKTNYKILFVDDEEKVLKAMRRIFRQENYTLFVAQSGQEALELLKDESVHVVISDHKMPGMTGAELLREIKALYPQTIRIMLTGYADVNAVMGAVNEGAVYKFITKPWNDDDLRLTVSLALEQFDLIQENKSLKKKTDIQKKEISKLSRFASVHRSQLGSILIRQNLIGKEDLDKALSMQSKSKKILPQILVEMGVVDEKTVIKAISTKLGINRVYPNEFTVSKELASLIPQNVCEKNLLVPLKHDGGRLIVAMADPTDYMKVDDLKFIVGLPIEPVLSAQKEIIAKLNEIFGKDDTLEAALSEIDIIDPTENIEIILEKEDEETHIDDLLSAKDQPPAIRIVNAIISDALRHGASDVHIEPKTKYLMVRYRIDDLLQDKLHIPISMHLAIVSRIKIMSELDIAERRRPQDGRVTVKTSSRMVDMRISTLPTINGEKVVLRVLDKNAAIKDIEQLGLLEKDYATISQFIEYPQGMILATGPTGSGKTSTLYSLLRKGAKITKNFTTIEDPVEFHMSMAEQVNVREKIGLGFPIILRSILRQDPNVIMLGEIRDHETAEVAFHAALTGHLVLSTLHTNNSVASITRLRDMGMKAYVISDALIGIIAQRLARRICSHCKVDDDPPEKTLNALKIFEKDFRLWKGAGCENCNQTGYKGRTGIYEVFQIDGEIKKMIHEDATDNELLRSAKLNGMTTLLDDAMVKMKSGITTCEEILRVFGPQNVLKIVCPECGVHLDERYRFCPFCGHTINLRCANCGNSLALNWIACPSCGKKTRQG